MRVSFALTLEDVLVAYWTATRPAWWRLLLGGLLCGALFGVVGYTQTPPGYDDVGAVFMAIAFPFGFGWLQRRKMRHDLTKALAAKGTFPELRTVWWDQTGLSWSVGAIEHHVPWSGVFRIQRTRQSILVWHGGNRFECLPLRVLTPENLATLLPLLAAVHENM